MMTDYLALSQQQQTCAFKMIDDLQIITLWQHTNATINLVGSLKIGLLAKHRDIDFHIYTTKLEIDKSFAVISQICLNPRVKKCEFSNLANTDENCFEWHIWAEDDENNLWQIDMIQILKGSFYDGYFEKVAADIQNTLTDETRNTILKLKFETPENIKISGIEYYKAVIQDNVRTFDELLNWHHNWQHTHTPNDIIAW